MDQETYGYFGPSTWYGCTTIGIICTINNQQYRGSICRSSPVNKMQRVNSCRGTICGCGAGPRLTDEHVENRYAGRIIR